MHSLKKDDLKKWEQKIKTERTENLIVIMELFLLELNKRNWKDDIDENFFEK